MRVLFVTNRYPSPGDPGASPCIEQQRSALQELGCTVDVLFMETARSRFDYVKGVLSILWNVQIRGRYDVVHAHYGAFCAAVARMQFRRPVVVTFRGSDLLSRREKPISRFVGRCADAAIVMTEQMRRELRRPDSVVLPYGVDRDLFRPGPRDDARRQLGLPMQSPLVLFPYDPERAVKRYHLLESAVRQLRASFPDIQIVTVFDQPHPISAQYMNACDVMALTSEKEGAPVAVREALSCNLPVVSVDVGDVSGLLRNVGNCYVVQAEPGAIAASLAEVLRSGRRCNGRDEAPLSGTTESAKSVLAVYDRLIRNHGAPQLRPR